MAKRSQQSVGYKAGKPQAHCSICKHWEPPASCSLVSGEIRPKGWCRLFEREGAADKHARRMAGSY